MRTVRKADARVTHIVPCCAGVNRERLLTKQEASLRKCCHAAESIPRNLIVADRRAMVECTYRSPAAVICPKAAPRRRPLLAELRRRSSQSGRTAARSAPSTALRKIPTSRRRPPGSMARPICDTNILES